jgi:hypothetical protein
LKAVDKTKGTNGFTALGQPILNFDSPILQMLNASNEIVYSDLTAIIAGPKSNGYRFRNTGDPNTSPVPYEPRRDWPFREFTIEYHELNDSQQAFPIYDYAVSKTSKNASLTPTLQAGGDAFAINYGSGGIGAEILANRFGVGPMNSCPDCRFEEFFLSSWTVGDPAMVVDSPANAPCNTGGTSPPDVTNGSLLKKYWANCTQGSLSNVPQNANPPVIPLRKATKANYPDDPSNIYHSYINDRVIFRTLHAGTGVSHVHHLHAHQWFHSPNSNGSLYLDSQLINPGSAYTMEIAHEGSGNLNKVVGDSIFHCHFYPHFAAGMWAHWRSHDVFEIGTQLDQYGKPLTGWNRAQPDGEIALGTPIPALVPMPSLPMAPMPARVRIVPVTDPNAAAGAPPVGWRAETNPDDLSKGLNPGYPFFIPGVGGTRAPHPPMDFAVDNGQTLDGGLPRHMIINAKVTEQHNYLDFSKDMTEVNSYQLPENGTDVEKVAMAYHAQCTHPTFDTFGAPAKYRTNGLPPQPGAPYADPGEATEADSDTCTPIKDWINYRAAVIQTDLVLNKVGWHYPQSRLITLWDDVRKTLDGSRTPEPFFFRANSRTGVNYWHTNLVPAYYELDDYQVRTPTDIIGQHIHLVKFDVTSSDGAANGFNYEDGTLSYQEVQEQIGAINQCGGLAPSLTGITKCSPTNTGRTKLAPTAPPAEICPDSSSEQCKMWYGAQTTVQRWYADPLSTSADTVNGERTLNTVFTHDHFGPSTHQQAGLYAALIVEPTGSRWFTNDTKQLMHDPKRLDGGPTSFAAIIETPGAEKDTFREFAIALQDFQFAYLPTSISTPGTVTGTQDVRGSTTPITVTVHDSWADPAHVVEPPVVQNKKISGKTVPIEPGPQLISAGPTSGTLSFNYRNEPLPFRVFPSTGDTKGTDLSYVFASNVDRNLLAVKTQPFDKPIDPAQPYGFKFPQYPLTPGMMPGDPYTPLLRAYEGDRVRIRVITGAHMLPHDFTVHGAKWLFEPSFNNSGYRSNQSMGISEHFEFFFDTPRASPSANADYNWSDYLYMPDASNQRHGIVDGMWGLFRAYKSTQPDLPYLSTNPTVKPLPPRANGYSCPDGAPVRNLTINAFTAGNLTTYNSRGADGAGIFPASKISNPYQLMYQFLAEAGAAVTSNIDEPLVLRANAGDCIALTLKNQMDPAALVKFPKTLAAFDPSKIEATKSTPPIKLGTSYNAGITPALLSYDVMTSAGMNIGFNPPQTASTGGQQTYYWYAGQTHVDANGYVTGTPMELGGVNLTPSDPLQQDLHGLVGGLVVEPTGSIACPDVYNPRNGLPQYASATVYDGGNCTAPGQLRHREFVLITTEDMSNLNWSQACYCPASKVPMDCSTNTCLGNVLKAISPPLLLQSSLNYRIEPMSYRFNTTSYNPLTTLWRGYSDGLVSGEPQTPIFAAARNTPSRFHLLHPGGSGDQQVVALHGHVWQELPYVNDSTRIGDNTLSMWLGKRDNYGTNTSYSIILDKNGGAGGLNGVTGDYLYRTTPANFVIQGQWGLFRVGQPGKDTVAIGSAQFISSLVVAGSTTAFLDSASNPKNGQRAATVSLSIRPKGSTGPGTPLQNGTLAVGEAGLWSYNSGPISLPDPEANEVVAVSPFGGTAVAPIVLNLVPGTPPSGPTTGQTVGESLRFVNMPRDEIKEDGTVIEQPTAKPEEGLLAPPSPVGTPQAPKSTPTPNPSAPPTPQP